MSIRISYLNISYLQKVLHSRSRFACKRQRVNQIQKNQNHLLSIQLSPLTVHYVSRYFLSLVIPYLTWNLQSYVWIAALP